MKKKVIAYLHSHWDREWYREFEVFRLRLLRVFDNVLELLKNDVIPSFYFDGQVIALLDYLELRPENEALVRELIKSKRLFIGPFYCLIDEFLAPKRAFEKNIEIGLKISREFGCEDFIVYFADTFGHSKNIVPILKEYGFDKCMVWRGCPDTPTEFNWNGINTVNLVRGYFMDTFSTPFPIEKKAEMIKDTLDKIAEKSSDVLLLPIGADHLGVETDIGEQIKAVNSLLSDYEITLGSPFDYFEAVKNNFKTVINEELRDNSKTFILPGCYSARMRQKQYCYKCDCELKLAEQYKKSSKYDTAIEYAYKLFIQNLAHDGICGCSTDLVHKQNEMRYEQILQITSSILAESEFDPRKHFQGVIEFESTQKHDDCQLVSIRQGFERELLYDTQRIPVTEDFGDVYKYLCWCGDEKPNDLYVSDTELKNSKIALKVKDRKIFVNDYEIRFSDYKDEGDTYNFGPIKDDFGKFTVINGCETIMKGELRCGLRINTSFFDVDVYLDKQSEYLDFKINWENNTPNHILQVECATNSPITTTYSADYGNLLKREFDSDYEIRNNLPKTRGIEAKTNTAPMQNYVWANGLGIKTEGLCEYEVKKDSLCVTLLRAVGIISNPKNPARSTPAGPPLEVTGAQQFGTNSVAFSLASQHNPRLPQ